jgi:hypothetical protein
MSTIARIRLIQTIKAKRGLITHLFNTSMTNTMEILNAVITQEVAYTQSPIEKAHDYIQVELRVPLIGWKPITAVIHYQKKEEGLGDPVAISLMGLKPASGEFFFISLAIHHPNQLTRRCALWISDRGIFTPHPETTRCPYGRRNLCCLNPSVLNMPGPSNNNTATTTTIPLTVPRGPTQLLPLITPVTSLPDYHITRPTPTWLHPLHPAIPAPQLQPISCHGGSSIWTPQATSTHPTSAPFVDPPVHRPAPPPARIPALPIKPQPRRLPQPPVPDAPTFTREQFLEHVEKRRLESMQNANESMEKAISLAKLTNDIKKRLITMNCVPGLEGFRPDDEIHNHPDMTEEEKRKGLLRRNIAIARAMRNKGKPNSTRPADPPMSPFSVHAKHLTPEELAVLHASAEKTEQPLIPTSVLETETVRCPPRKRTSTVAKTPTPRKRTRSATVQGTNVYTVTDQENNAVGTIQIEEVKSIPASQFSRIPTILEDMPQLEVNPISPLGSTPEYRPTSPRFTPPPMPPTTTPEEPSDAVTVEIPLVAYQPPESDSDEFGEGEDTNENIDVLN